MKRTLLNQTIKSNRTIFNYMYGTWFQTKLETSRSFEYVKCLAWSFAESSTVGNKTVVKHVTLLYYCIGDNIINM